MKSLRRRKMPKDAKKTEKKKEDDGDYEAVSSEDFSEKLYSKTDSLTLNDNINYRLCYETHGKLKKTYEGEGSSNAAETSLDGDKNVSNRRKPQKSASGLEVPNTRDEDEEEPNVPTDQTRYQRFSPRSNFQQACDELLSSLPVILTVLVVLVLFAVVFWAAIGVLEGTWGEEHYRKLWERAHPESTKKPSSPPVQSEKPTEKITPVVTQSETVPNQAPENRYHDHNNLSTKNKNAGVETKKVNATIDTKKTNATVEVKKEKENASSGTKKDKENASAGTNNEKENASAGKKKDKENASAGTKKEKDNACEGTNKEKENASEGTNKEKKEQKIKTYVDMLEEQKQAICKSVPDIERFCCGPELNYTVCGLKGCCWLGGKGGSPTCFYPPGYDSFKFVNMIENKQGIRVNYEQARHTGHPGDFSTAAAVFKYYSDEILQIKIYDPEHRRFEPPLPRVRQAPGPNQPKYRVQVESGTVGFKVFRNSDNVTLINTQDAGGMILSDKYLEISTLLPTDRIFGLGENREPFRKNLKFKTITMYNRDITPRVDFNLYGSHPFYLAIEKDGKSHGVFFLTSNPIDVSFTPSPALSYRVIGGIITLFVFVGPTPEAVLAQYTSIIGRPFLPPYWSLGFHLSKLAYSSLQNTENIWKANREAGIPFDTQWNDRNSMQSNDFTYNTIKYGGLPEFVKKLHRHGMHYVIVVAPGANYREPSGASRAYDLGMMMDVFIKNTSGLPYHGRVWAWQSTLFPDFTNPNSTRYWTQLISDFHQKVQYDGIGLDLNEPVNLLRGQITNIPCAPLKLSYRPFWTHALNLNHKTVCIEARHYIGEHLDVHNIYSLYQAAVTNFALKEVRGKRPFIISRSTFAGSGRYAGHTTGEAYSTWEDMRASIKDILNFNLFGIPMTGADICGYQGVTTLELCKRWMQLGAFYPFARNHADPSSSPQDPASWGPEMVEHAKTWLKLRYRMLPYYYTLFWRAHIDGTTVVTPLVFLTNVIMWAEAKPRPTCVNPSIPDCGQGLSPENEALDYVEDQFLIGRRVLISPIVEEGADSTAAYFPGPHKWYNLQNGRYVARAEQADIGEGDIATVQGGAILPLQEPAARGPITTANTRSRPLQLLVVPDNEGNANGELYWDDGDSINSYQERKYSHIEFTLKNEVLSNKIVWWGYGVPFVNNITILGVTRPVKSVTINGSLAKFEYKGNKNILCIRNLNLSLDKPFVAEWTYSDIIMKKIGVQEISDNANDDMDVNVEVED